MRGSAYISIGFGEVFHVLLAEAELFFFFFQAEDGIRDTSVTGVQTCALPICPSCLRGRGPAPRESPSRSPCGSGRSRGSSRSSHPSRRSTGRRTDAACRRPGGRQIGRASCRERVWSWAEGGSW